MWWDAQAMWSGLRRLCGGFCENNAKLSPTQFELGLRLILAINYKSYQVLKKKERFYEIEYVKYFLPLQEKDEVNVFFVV